MKSLRDLSPQLALAGIVALQISCGDSSGPGVHASSITASSSTTLAAAPGAAVAELPSVVVRDANGNALSGVAVTFAVASGGGSITGGNAVSNASGEAHVGSWTLGSVPGTNTLTATAAGLPAVTFTAQGADPCDTGSAIAHTIGSTTNAALSASDCRLQDGTFTDLYSVNIPSGGTYVFNQNAIFDTFLYLLTQGAVPVAINDDIDGVNRNSSIKAILPAGSFILAANSYDPNTTGNYSLASASSTAHVTNCEVVFLYPGVSSPQSLQATDCSLSGTYADEYIIFLQAGQSITLSMTSSEVDSYLEVFLDPSASALASNDNIDGTTQNSQLAFSPPSNGFYTIRARSAAAGAIGAYTLGVQ